MSKLIYASSLAAFKKAYADWEQPTSAVYRSIGYTEDGYLYTHGKVFKMSVEGVDNPWGLSTALTKQKLSVTLGGYTSDVTLPVVGIKTTTEDELTISSLEGIHTVVHAEKFSTVQGIGPTVASNTTIAVPRITYSKTGHITAASYVTATLNHVLQEVDTTSTTAYALFGLGAGTAGSKYNINIKANLTSGAFYATTLYEGNKALSAIYAPIIHSSDTAIYGMGTGSAYGHVKLSDSISSTSPASSGIAATPKAILDSLNAAKAYSKELLGTTDAMLFVGTLNGTGVIQSHNTIVIPSGVVDGTTNISALVNYSAGWTFKVTAPGTIANIGKVEVGDMLIASNNFVTAYKASDWSVIQANIDGAVIASASLAANAVVVGAGTTAVKSLANGSNGQYLIINSGGIPAWTSVGVNMRAIKFNGGEFLTSTAITPLDLTSGTGISLSGNATTGALTIKNTGVLDTFALSINNDTTLLGSYQPKTAAATLKFVNGIQATLSGTTYTIGHTNSSTVRALGLYQFSVDAQGHIDTGNAITSLPNTAALIIANAAGNTIDSYIGSLAKTLKFSNGTDITLTTTSAANIITVTPSITHKYRGISIQPSGQSTATSIYSDTAAGTVTFKAGTNLNIVNAAGVLTFNATDTNTWRNVKAIIAGTNVTTEVLSSSIGVSDLEFGSDFLWTEAGNNGKLQIGWAEIDANGNVSYIV